MGHQVLAYADDVNIVRENLDTIRKNTKALFYASKEVGLEVNPEKTKYMLMSHSQKIGQKHSIKIGNRSFEDVAKSKYLGTTLTDQNCMHEEIKSRLNLGDTCYRSVQSLLSSCLLSRNLKVKIYKMIILPVNLYGCEAWSLVLREEYRLRVFQNRVLRRIFGSCTVGSFITCTHHQILLGRSNQGQWSGACGMHGRGKKHVQGFGGKA
jgi:hypothetical protein